MFSFIFYYNLIENFERLFNIKLERCILFKSIVKKCNQIVKTYSLTLYTFYKKLIINRLIFILFFLSGILINHAQEETQYIPEKIKISLRQLGNELLLSNQDSVSRILPITKINDQEYRLSFQENLFIDPDVLTEKSKRLISNSAVWKDHIIEVIECRSSEVVYSYQISGVQEQNIVPCIGRKIPKNCYEIRVIFPKAQLVSPNNADANSTPVLWILIGIGLLFAILLGIKYTILDKKKDTQRKLQLGNTSFFYDQQLLKYNNEVTKLTTKEAELLKIFADTPNQIIKRELLIKLVWEDQGVIVGRSLDMFISKLRKKLNGDTSIKITNIHGVGYKMEI